MAPEDRGVSQFDYKKDYVHVPGRHIQQFINKVAKRLKVWIEVYPDLYYLDPGDELTIIYDEDPKWPGLGLTTFVDEDSLQIYLQEFDTAIILINGQPAQRVS